MSDADRWRDDYSMQVGFDLDDLGVAAVLDVGQVAPGLTADWEVLAIVLANGAIALGRVGSGWVFKAAGGAGPLVSVGVSDSDSPCSS